MSEYEKIINLIAENKLLEAIDLLSDLDTEGTHRVALINIKGMNQSLKENIIRGLITKEEVSKEENRLRYALLQVLDLVIEKDNKKGSSGDVGASKHDNHSINYPSSENESSKLTLTKTIIPIIASLIIIGAIYGIREYFSPKGLTIFLQGTGGITHNFDKKDSLEFYAPKSNIKLKVSISYQGRVDYLIPSQATKDKFKLILYKEGYNINHTDSLYDFPSKSLSLKIHRMLDSTIIEEITNKPEYKSPSSKHKFPKDTLINPTLSQPDQDSIEVSPPDEIENPVDTVKKKLKKDPPVFYDLTILSSKKMGEIYVDGRLSTSKGGYADTINLIESIHHIIIKNTRGEVIKDAKINLKKNTTIDLL